MYGECECFVMQMLYVCVLCASCGSSQISLPQFILKQIRCQITSITTMSPLQHTHTRHTPSLQLQPHTHHSVTPGFVDRSHYSDGAAGQFERYAGWCTKSGIIGPPPPTQTRVKGVGRHNNKKWGYYEGDTTCDCGVSSENTRHVLECPLLVHACSLDDLLQFNEKVCRTMADSGLMTR